MKNSTLALITLVGIAATLKGPQQRASSDPSFLRTLFKKGARRLIGPAQIKGTVTKGEGYNLLLLATPKTLPHSLEKGDRAQLVFVGGKGTQEPLWVKVTRAQTKDGKPVFSGEIDEAPSLAGLSEGQSVRFVPGHILAVEFTEG